MTPHGAKAGRRGINATSGFR